MLSLVQKTLLLKMRQFVTSTKYHVQRQKCLVFTFNLWITYSKHFKACHFHFWLEDNRWTILPRFPSKLKSRKWFLWRLNLDPSDAIQSKSAVQTKSAPWILLFIKNLFASPYISNVVHINYTREKSKWLLWSPNHLSPILSHSQIFWQPKLSPSSRSLPPTDQAFTSNIVCKYQLQWEGTQLVNY